MLVIFNANKNCHKIIISRKWLVNLNRIFFLGTKKTTQLINVIKHCGIITLIYKSLKKSLIKIYFMLSLFDHITTKKPQFDAYPFSNQSVIQR